SELKDGAKTPVGKRPLALALYIPPDFGPGHPAQAWTNGRPNPFLITLVQSELTRLQRANVMQAAGVDPSVARLIEAPAPIVISGSGSSQQQRQVMASIVPSARGYVLLT